MKKTNEKWSDLDLQHKKYYIVGYTQESLSDTEMNDFFEWYNTPEYEDEIDNMLDNYEKVSNFVETELASFEIKYQKKHAKKNPLFSHQYKWAIAATIMMIAVVSLWFFINGKSEKDKENNIVKKQENQQIIPKTNKDSLKNTKNNVVEKEEKIENILPKKDTSIIPKTKEKDLIASLDNEIKNRLQSEMNKITRGNGQTFDLKKPINKQIIKSDSLYFEWQGKLKEVNVEFFNQFDNSIKYQVVPNKTKININDLENGIYILRVKTVKFKPLFVGYFEVKR